MTKNKKATYLVNLIGVVLLYGVLYLLIAGGFLSSYYRGILLMIGINIILATSLNLTTGFLGQLALGHAGFMSIGAYTAAIFTKTMLQLPTELRFPIGVLLGGLLAALFGLAVGIPALRLKGDYLAIITLGFGEIIRVIIENLQITGGGQGLIGIPRLTNFNAVFFTTVLIVALLYALIRSRHGRAIIAIREDEIAAEACGIKVTYYRTLAFTLAAFLAGIAGGLYAHYIGVLGAADFGFNRSIDIVVMVVLGGMGSFTGSIVAAVVLTALPELLRGFAGYRMILYSLALVAMMIFKPSGLMGNYEFSLSRLLKKLALHFKHSKTKEEGGKSL